MPCIFHKWNGCICVKCGKTRDENHTVEDCACTVCKKEIHTYKNYKCINCGKTDKDVCVFYNDGICNYNEKSIGPCILNPVKEKSKCEGIDKLLLYFAGDYYKLDNDRQLALVSELLSYLAATGKVGVDRIKSKIDSVIDTNMSLAEYMNYGRLCYYLGSSDFNEDMLKIMVDYALKDPENIIDYQWIRIGALDAIKVAALVKPDLLNKPEHVPFFSEIASKCKTPGEKDMLRIFSDQLPVNLRNKIA